MKLGDAVHAMETVLKEVRALTSENAMLKVEVAQLHYALAHACVPRLRELLQRDANAANRGEEGMMGGDQH